jgi:hypothetical protein
MPDAGCVVAPRAACGLSAVPGAGILQMKDGTPDTKDALQWKWLRGSATTLGDFGDPVAGDAYDLCVYDGDSSLLLHASIPGGGTCGGKPCWKAAGRTGFAYTANDASPEGITSVRLKAGGAGQASVVVKGKGPNLRTPALLGMALPLRVQLQRSDGTCWGADFSTAQVGNATRFAARAD